MMDIKIFIDGAALLIGLMLIVASFVSKTMVSGRMMGGKPQKITWFGRIWMFLAGSAAVYGFGLAILKQLHVAINPSWSQKGDSLSQGVLYLLFLSVAVPGVIVSVRDLWLKRKEETRIQRAISLFLVLIFSYFIGTAIPVIWKEVSAIFHR
jgi:hypothetical protein